MGIQGRQIGGWSGSHHPTPKPHIPIRSHSPNLHKLYVRDGGCELWKPVSTPRLWASSISSSASEISDQISIEFSGYAFGFQKPRLMPMSLSQNINESHVIPASAKCRLHTPEASRNKSPALDSNSTGNDASCMEESRPAHSNTATASSPFVSARKRFQCARSD